MVVSTNKRRCNYFVFQQDRAPSRWQLVVATSENPNNFLFQQDRAPSHWHTEVRGYLKEELCAAGSSSIQIMMPLFVCSRSCDLTVSDFFLLLGVQ